MKDWKHKLSLANALLSSEATRDVNSCKTACNGVAGGGAGSAGCQERLHQGLALLTCHGIHLSL